MATILDTTALGSFAPIFTWLFTAVVLFALLQKLKIAGGKPMFDGLLAFSLSIIVLFSPTYSGVVSFITPWFIILGVFFLFVMLISQFLGVQSEHLLASLGGERAAWWILIPGFIILAFALSSVFGQTFLEERTGEITEVTLADGTIATTTDHQQSVLLTLTNPNVLGMILIMIIAVFTIIFITAQGK